MTVQSYSHKVLTPKAAEARISELTSTLDFLHQQDNGIYDLDARPGQLWLQLTTLQPDGALQKQDVVATLEGQSARFHLHGRDWNIQCTPEQIRLATWSRNAQAYFEVLHPQTSAGLVFEWKFAPATLC